MIKRTIVHVEVCIYRQLLAADNNEISHIEVCHDFPHVQSLNKSLHLALITQSVVVAYCHTAWKCHHKVNV